MVNSPTSYWKLWFSRWERLIRPHYTELETGTLTWLTPYRGRVLFKPNEAVDRCVVVREHDVPQSGHPLCDLGAGQPLPGQAVLHF